MVRTAGVVPSVVAVLAMPPVTAAAVHVAKVVGRSIISVAKSAWSGTKSLLGRCGSTGTQVVESLRRTGSKVAETAKVVVGHPMMAPVVHALKAAVSLIRPVSQGFVANRLVAALVPVLWLRAVIGLLFMPFLVDFNLAGNVWNWVTTQLDDPATTDDTQGTDDEGDLLINTFGATAMPTGTVPSEGAEQADVAEQGSDTEQDEPFLNRAERRAQQREDRRTQHPHR